MIISKSNRYSLKDLPPILILWAALVALSACAVGMATSGKEDPNLSACQVGSSQLQIERELGAPKSSRVMDNGSSVSVYEYELGNEPSTGRAVLHGGLDILTIGLWEVVGTTIEATMGTKYEMTVEYGPDGVATAVTSRKVK